MANSKAVRILYGEAEGSAFEQTGTLRGAGYAVSEVAGRADVQTALENA
ncbi:MAG: hypothetical protein ACE14L_00170 [Terriglobales bacterium]